MLKTKFSVILSIFIIILIKNQTTSEYSSWINLKFKSVKCFLFDPTYAKFNKCYIKAVSRKLSTLNFHMEVLKIVRGPINVEVDFFLRFNTITRQIYPTVRFDWCAIMRGDGIMEKFAEFILSLLKDTIPQEYFHKCPYLPGPYNLSNVYFNISELPLSKMLGTGLYKLNITIIHRNSKLGTMAVAAEVSSDYKWQ